MDNIEKNFDKLPLDALKEIMKIYIDACKKYGLDDWRKIESEVYLYRLLVNVIKFKEDDSDKDLKIRKLSHIIWNALAILYKELFIDI